MQCSTWTQKKCRAGRQWGWRPQKVNGLEIVILSVTFLCILSLHVCSPSSSNPNCRQPCSNAPCRNRSSASCMYGTYTKCEGCCILCAGGPGEQCDKYGSHNDVIPCGDGMECVQPSEYGPGICSQPPEPPSGKTARDGVHVYLYVQSCALIPL